MIIDCFPWFAPYGEELLVLRVNLLKDHVDKFIIVESNKTHSGKPVERKFLEIARKNGLPMEKIIYVEHDIPETEDLEILPIDRRNAGHNNVQIESLYARVRERIQKDAVMDGMAEFADDDVFIYGDADEVINLQNIQWVANIVKNNPQVLCKIPLVYLQGRADLRIHHQDGRPVVWWRAMFFATKSQITKYKISNIRCGAIDIPVRWPTHNNKVCQDMGWHFAWMGDNAQRTTKAESFAHAYDKFKWQSDSNAGTYSKYDTFVESTKPIAGAVAPDGNPDHILRDYPIDKLPKMIFENDMIKDFLLPKTNINDPEKFSFNNCDCYWCTNLKWPLMYNLDGKRYWFEIPRSCSVTIKETFPDRKQIFRADPEYDDVIENKIPIVVLADPMDRFVSLLNVYLTEGQRYYSYGKDVFSKIGINLDNCSKYQKIDKFFENIHKFTGQHQVHHFHPQVMFIDTENFSEFQMVQKHGVSKFFDIETVHNKTRKEILESDLTDEQKDFIRLIYKKDYEFIEKNG